MVNGISVNSNNSFNRYNKWTVDVATGKTTQDFEYSNNEPDKELDNLSDGWIKHYDTNGDGKVEFLEYARTELKEFKQQYGEIDKSMMDKITNNLMNTFLRLNVDDDILQEVLSNSSSEKMKNIVNTIQQEQNAIIRNVTDKNLIVQGIAGSGKTSVALHRIAFLLYKIENLSSNNVLIFSPNQVFLFLHTFFSVLDSC